MNLMNTPNPSNTRRASPNWRKPWPGADGVAPGTILGLCCRSFAGRRALGPGSDGASGLRPGRRRERFPAKTCMIEAGLRGAVSLPQRSRSG